MQFIAALRGPSWKKSSSSRPVADQIVSRRSPWPSVALRGPKLAPPNSTTPPHRSPLLSKRPRPLQSHPHSSTSLSAAGYSARTASSKLAKSRFRRATCFVARSANGAHASISSTHASTALTQRLTWHDLIHKPVTQRLLRAEPPARQQVSPSPPYPAPAAPAGARPRPSPPSPTRRLRETQTPRAQPQQSDRRPAQSPARRPALAHSPLQ